MKKIYKIYFFDFSSYKSCDKEKILTSKDICEEKLPFIEKR